MSTTSTPSTLSSEKTSFNPAEFESGEGAELLNQITEFIGRYLQCSQHQRTVLALWVLHTYCLPAAQVTPYLFIRSAKKQSGKSLCLQLLSLLCDHPALTASFTASTLSRRIDSDISTVLLDECQATVGTRARSKSPSLNAILAAGCQCGPGYTDGKSERNAFAPKAFAGMGQLPEALADRSISIVLKPLQHRGAQSPSSANTNKDAACNTVAPLGAQTQSGPQPLSTAPRIIQRFHLRRAAAEAEPLQERIYFWAEGNLPALEEMPPYAEEDFPPNLCPRRQDMIEPLLQLADFIGAEWPALIRAALAAIFQEEQDFELRHSLQLLADIRDCFAYNGYPTRLSTATLLEWMHTRSARPWDVDGPITARAIARLLAPFNIHPRLQRISSADPARGYQLADFTELWKAHFNFEVPTRPAREEILQLLKAQIVAQARPSQPEPVAAAPEETEIPNKDVGCNAVTHSGAIPISGSENTPASTKPTSQNGNLEAELAEAIPIPPQSVSNNGFLNPAQLGDLSGIAL